MDELKNQKQEKEYQEKHEKATKILQRIMLKKHN